MEPAAVPVLYHYTNDAALGAILASGVLHPSLFRSHRRDVRYGEGQYLTDVSPGSMTGAQLSRLLLGHPFQASRFTHYIALNVDGLPIRRGRPGVFVILNTIALPLEGKIISTGWNADDLYAGSVESPPRR